MRADGARTHTCAYDIEITWGDGEVLCREHVYPAAPFALTTRSDAGEQSQGGRAFWVAEGWIPGEREVLVTMENGEAFLKGAAASTKLVPGAALDLTVGPLTIAIRGVEPERVGALRERPVDVRSHGFTLASFLLHVLALGCMALMPPRASSLSLDLATQDVQRMRYLLTRAEPESPALPWERRAGAAAARERAGAPPSEGKTRAPSAELRVSKKRHPAAARASAQNAGTQGVLGVLRAQAGALAAHDMFTPGELGGYDLTDIVGPGGDGVAEFGRLGMRNPGRPGGVGPGGVSSDGAIAVGPLDTRSGVDRSLNRHGALRERHAFVPRVRPIGEAQVKGSLAKEVIRRTIQRHLNEVRFCYERALRDQPELSGRVVVGFLIAPSGAVQAASLDASSLHSRAVEECIVLAVRRWSFPAPDAGGFVRVSYPFLLESAAP